MRRTPEDEVQSLEEQVDQLKAHNFMMLEALTLASYDERLQSSGQHDYVLQKVRNALGLRGETGSSILSRLVVSALEFCREDLAIRKHRRSLGKCSSGDPDSGRICDPGEDADLCLNCLHRYASKPTYQGALKRRAQAKTRMIRAARRMDDGILRQ